MKKLVWLTVHGEQKYEGMSADSSELRERMDTYLGEFEQHGTDNITVEM